MHIQLQASVPTFFIDVIRVSLISTAWCTNNSNCLKPEDLRTYWIAYIPFLDHYLNRIDSLHYALFSTLLPQPLNYSYSFNLRKYGLKLQLKQKIRTTKQKNYIGGVYCCSSCHANILIWDQLKVQVLQNDCKSNNCFQQCKLITHTLTRPSTEWNEPAIDSSI